MLRSAIRSKRLVRQERKVPWSGVWLTFVVHLEDFSFGFVSAVALA
jgi:hypothetical protein